MPHLDSRLCILLSVTPLAIVGVIKKEIGSLSPVKMEATMEAESGLNQVPSVKHGLVSSVQLLRQFSGLLSPPPSVVTAANSAAQKAASFVSSFKRSAKVIDHWEASVEAGCDISSFYQYLSENNFLCNRLLSRILMQFIYAFFFNLQLSWKHGASYSGSVYCEKIN